jgi:flagellar export protein FliJ
VSRYRFRLATVLRVRRVAEGLARLELAHAAAARARAVARLDAARAAAGRLPVIRGPMSAEAFALERARHEAALVGLAVARERLRLADDDMAVRTVRWRDAKRRLEVLERLEARRRAEWALDEARRQAKALDELALAGFVRRAEA